MNMLAISEVRSNLPNIVDNISKYLDRVVISVNGKPKAVMISAEELESLEETADILAIPGSLESIKQGMKEAKQGKGTPAKELLKRYKI